MPPSVITAPKRLTRQSVSKRTSAAAPAIHTTTNITHVAPKQAGKSGSRKLSIKDNSTGSAATGDILATPYGINGFDPATPKGYNKDRISRRRIKGCAICRALDHTGSSCTLPVAVSGETARQGYRDRMGVDPPSAITEDDLANKGGSGSLKDEMLLDTKDAGAEHHHGDWSNVVQMMDHQGTISLNTSPPSSAVEGNEGLAGAISCFAGETLSVEGTSVFSYVELLEADDPLEYLAGFNQAPPFLSYLQDYVRASPHVAQSRGNPEFLTWEQAEEIATSGLQETHLAGAI